MENHSHLSGGGDSGSGKSYSRFFRGRVGGGLLIAENHRRFSGWKGGKMGI